MTSGSRAAWAANGRLRKAMSVIETSSNLLVLAAVAALAGCNAALPVGRASAPPVPSSAAPMHVPARDLPFAFEAPAAPPPDDAPRILVVGDRVLLDSVDVGDVSVVIASHRLMSIDGLLDALRARGVKHPSDGLIAVFAFGDDATAAVVKSVLQTATAAGYPRARLVVRTLRGIGYFEVDPRVPGPPSDIPSSTKPPGTSTTNGRLAPEIIQRIVRSHFGEFKVCFEVGLRTAPDLAGTARIKFVIALDGSVSSAVDGGSTLPDPTVISCVARAIGALVFPNPEGGIVTVLYPIIFSPGDP